MSAVASPRDLVPRMRDLRAEGHSAPSIGVILGIPGSTVRNWWNAGACVDCGVAVEHSNGVGAARCGPCDRTHARVWTREVVLDAIQRFAAANGRPPLSAEWIRADSVNGYPPRSAVYRGGWGAEVAAWSWWSRVRRLRPASERRAP